MTIVKRVVLVIAFVVSMILSMHNVKAHNDCPKLDNYIKTILAYNWLYMILLCVYLIYRIVTM